MNKTLREAMIEFSDFINEPPQYEDKRMVRDYRHELAPKWLALVSQIEAALGSKTAFLTWEDVAPSICTSCSGTCDAANQGPDNEMSAARFMEQHGCESKEVYEAAQRVAEYVNDLAGLQEEGWKRAQIILARHRRKSPGFQKLKVWWSEDKNWFCILSDDGINQTTISLTVEEASVLSGNAEPPIEKIPSAEARAERLNRDQRG